MIHAVEGLLASGVRNLGLLFVVGEERNSVGAYTASKSPRGSKFLINGEPTENKLALGSKGALRYESSQTAGWRTRRIPNSASPPSKNFWMPCRDSGRSTAARSGARRRAR